MQRLANRRIWLGGGALAAAVIVALSWFLLVGPGLAAAHDLRDQTAAAHQQNLALSVKAASLKAKSAHAATYASSLRTAVDGVPYTSGLPAFTRQVHAQATAHQVELSSVSVGGVTPLVSSTGAETPTAPGVFSMQVSLQSTGALKDQLAFLADMRKIGPRRALITSVQVSPASGASRASVDTASTLATQVTIFAAPRTPEQVKQLNKLLAGDLDG